MNRTKTTTIVLHHSVTPQTWDKTKTMANIKGSHGGTSPYHHVIGKDWMYADPNMQEVKFHAGNYPVNLESVAVCLAGNFTVDTLTVYQKNNLRTTLKQWMQQYGIKRVNIKLHREVRLQPTACPGKPDQSFITILLASTMPTCDQLLADEKRQHAETVERERDNYANWQTTLDEKNKLRDQLAEEKRQHAESIAEKLKNAAERDAALAKLKVCEESETLTPAQQKDLALIEQIRQLLA